MSRREPRDAHQGESHPGESTRRVIYVGLVGNTFMALAKFAAAAVSGSTAMLAEGVHSVMDAGNQVLLLYGLRRARQPPDDAFPFGYGKEVYFWTLVVAMQVLTVGAGLTIARGVVQMLHPRPLGGVALSYAVLGMSALFDGAAWLLALQDLSRTKGKWTYLEAVQHGKDPSRFMVLFEDTASLLGLTIAAAGITAEYLTGEPVFDGLASVLIGLVLAVSALWLAYETKGLLIGESANSEVVDDIRRIASEVEGVREVRDVRSVHMGPQYIVVGLNAVVPGGNSADSGRMLALLEDDIRRAHPRIKQVFVKIVPS